MAIHTLPTQFAPAERTSRKGLLQQAARMDNIPLLRQLLDAVPDIILILNEQRQIVFANRALMETTHLIDISEATGLRPGEALDCIHASESESGCGTTTFCKTCGAARVILSSLRSKGNLGENKTATECRINLKNGDALDLLCYASPMVLDGQKYSFFVLKDMSHEKRRLMLEHVFFHDILNSASALRGLADVMLRAPLDEKDEIASDISLVCDRLIDEVKSQQELIAAENNELQVTLNFIDTRLFLEEFIGVYQRHQAERDRRIYLAPGSCQVSLFTDPILLQRVLGNMLKNALEACPPGETVTIGCRKMKRRVGFWVHNPGAIPEEMRSKIFQRSYSTKGTGRGLGTYSIKLLGERYLHGKVSFTTSPTEGTLFKISLPLGEGSA